MASDGSGAWPEARTIADYQLLVSVATPQDRGPEFDGVKIGRPATRALIDAGYRRLADLPEEKGELLQLHGVGPSAVRRLQAVRNGH